MLVKQQRHKEPARQAVCVSYRILNDYGVVVSLNFCNGYLLVGKGIVSGHSIGSTRKLVRNTNSSLV